MPGSMDFEYLPVLSGERVNNLLLDTLLASDLEALVLAYSHYLTSLQVNAQVRTNSSKIQNTRQIFHLLAFTCPPAQDQRNEC